MRVRLIYSGLALLLAAALLVTLVRASGVSATELWALLRRPTAAYLIAIVLTSLVHMGCSALKWRAVMRRVAPAESEAAGLRFFFFYSCLGGGLAQFLTVHASSLLVRGLATRLHHRVPFSRGAATSIYEQAFDVVVLVVVGLTTAAALALGWGLGSWLGLVAASLVAAALGLVWLAGSATRLFALPSAASPEASLLGRIKQWLGLCIGLGVVERRLVLRLYALSLVRYIAMFVRALLIAQAVGFVAALADVALAFPIVQAAQIVALTPGSLGIVEWTWSGALVAMGHDFTDAVGFALTLRVLSYASILAVLAGAALAFILRRRAPNSASNPPTAA